MHGLHLAGRMVQSNDRLSTAVVYYLRHVVVQQEWPSGTTFQEYIGSLRSIIQDAESGLYLSRFMGVWTLAFLGRSQRWRGPGGADWILVEYRPDYGFWVTGFQPRDGLVHVTGSQHRTDGRWLQQPS